MMRTMNLKRFLGREDGAVTIDWVVLTAGIAVLGLIAIGAISSAISDTSVTIGETISAASN